MSRLHLDEIQAGLAAIATLERSPEYKQRLQQATASDHPDEYVQKIEAMKKSFRDQANQTKYESQQRLASLFREMSHVLTDLVHSMSLVGDDTSSMQKLAGQVVKITKSISFNGENDKDNNLVKDDINLSLQDSEEEGDEDDDSEDEDDDELDLGEGKSNKRADKAFRNAVKSIKPVSEDDSKKDDKKPKKDTEESEEDEESDESDDPTDEKSAKEAPKKSDDKKSKKDNKKDNGKKSKSGSGGFVDGLMSEDESSDDKDTDDAEAADEDAESEDANYAETACISEDFGFTPYVVTSAWIRIKGERVQALKVISIDDAGTITASYYRPTKKFFSGDSARVLKAFSGIQQRVPGYNTLLEEIHSKTESGHLTLLHTTEVNPEVLSDLPEFHAVGGRDANGRIVVSRAGITLKYNDKKSKKTERVVKRLLATLPYTESNARIRRFLKKNAKLVLKKTW
jgi:hypothetical protein